MILAMRDLLIEKGILTADQIRRGLETLDSWQPSRGAEIVARAWTDPVFKRRLLADGNRQYGPGLVYCKFPLQNMYINISTMYGDLGLDLTGCFKTQF